MADEGLKEEKDKEMMEEKEIGEISNEISVNNGEIVDTIASIDKNSQLETLILPDDQELDFVPAISNSLALFPPPGFKIDQVGMSHQQVLACVTAQAQAQQSDEAGNSYTSMELLPVPIKQSLSSKVTPGLLCRIPPMLNQDYNAVPEVKPETPSDQKIEPSPDGFNWRKYGQKPVKGNDSSRSYYRCTYTDCLAKKKVERCDQSSRVIEIVYKGSHNHDPPQKVRSKTRRSLPNSGSISSPETCEGTAPIDSPTTKLSNSNPSTPRKRVEHATPHVEPHSSMDSASNANAESEDTCDHLHAKRRMKGRSGDTLYKIIKEPKVIVQAAEDVGISGDGYRWRKYGQKMVKGNSHPRSYYKCTSSGCPVRKHVERATDDTPTLMITYEGKHDHDMPTPKKHQDPPNASLVVAASTTAMDTTNNPELIQPLALVDPKCSIPQAMDVESSPVPNNEEKPAEIGGGEKALESAQTLLSIGIELKPC
ncbi:WRKY Transcription Factor [Ranunculus cassubicifolius]